MIIKRYSNRKLYDTEARHYVTLDDIANAIRQGEDVQVFDHVTGSDLTSLTLMQIIFEEEKKIGEILPQVVLTRLLRGGSETLDSMRTRLLAAFDPQQQAQEEIERRLNRLVQHGEMTREEAAALLRKLGGTQPAEAQPEPEPQPEPQAATEDLDGLLKQVEALETELARLKNQKA